VEDLCFVVVGALLVGINLFSLEGHAFHGVDSLVCFVVCLISFRCLSQRRVGGSYALRVSPAVTRLTVYRRPQVARDPVVTFERRSKVTKTYGQRNFLAYRRCHCYTTAEVMGVPSQNCDAVLVHKLRSRMKQMQSVMYGQLMVLSGFMACGLDLRVFPAETRLTVYCWLQVINYDLAQCLSCMS